MKKWKQQTSKLLPIIQDYINKSTTTETGLKIYTIKEGNGEKPQQNESLKLYYEGYFNDGKLFGTNVKSVDENCGTYNEIKEQREYV